MNVAQEITKSKTCTQAVAVTQVKTDEGRMFAFNSQVSLRKGQEALFETVKITMQDTDTPGPYGSPDTNQLCDLV